LLEFRISIKSYENANKVGPTTYTFISNSFIFSCFSNDLACCKCTRIIFHCANDLVVLRSCAS